MILSNTSFLILKISIDSFLSYLLILSLPEPHPCRTHAQTSVDTSIGFANPHSNDQVYQSFHWMQPPSNSPSPVVRASMSSNRRRSNRLGGRLPAGETASSLEETRNSNPEHLANLTEQDLQAQADFNAYELLLERIKNERFFPDRRDPSSDAWLSCPQDWSCPQAEQSVMEAYV